MLAVNAAKDSTDLVAKMRAYHHKAQAPGDRRQQSHCNWGLDLVKGVVINNLEAGVIEPAMSKIKMIQVNIIQKVHIQYRFASLGYFGVFIEPIFFSSDSLQLKRL